MKEEGLAEFIKQCEEYIKNYYIPEGVIKVIDMVKFRLWEYGIMDFNALYSEESLVVHSGSVVQPLTHSTE